MPPKVRIFIWCSLLNILLTKDNLNRRDISQLGGCTICGANETVSHVLLQCPMATSSWSLYPAWANFYTESLKELQRCIVG